MRIENREIYWEGFRMDNVVQDLGIENMPEDVIDELLFLTKETFEAMAHVFSPTAKWKMYSGRVTIGAGDAYCFPEDLFFDDIRDKAVDAVSAPLFGRKMYDGMSSPLQNKVEGIMLYLPEDKFSYLED